MLLCAYRQANLNRIQYTEQEDTLIIAEVVAEESDMSTQSIELYAYRSQDDVR